MAKCQPCTNLLEVSVKVGTDTVCTMLVRNISDIVDITTLPGASVTLKTIRREFHDGASIREQESVCNENNAQNVKNEDDEPIGSNDDILDSLLRLTACINENRHNGMIPRSASICNTELSFEDSDGGQPESGTAKDGTTAYSQWPLPPSLCHPQFRINRMLRKVVTDHPMVAPKEPLMGMRGVAVQQKTGSELLGPESQIPVVRMVLLHSNLKWVFWIEAECHDERLDRWNMSQETEEHLVFMATCCVLDRPAVSSIADSAQGTSDQFHVLKVTTSLVYSTNKGSWTVERSAWLVPCLEDHEAAADSVVMGNQASLENMPLASRTSTAAGSKAVENQVSPVQGAVDSKTKARETQASHVQGSVDSQTAATSKAMEIQASLVQGSVDSQMVAGSNAMETQASLVQGSVDGQIFEGSKAMENQASLVQGSVDSQMVAGSKAMENQASLVQGSVDSQMVAISKAMENQASLVQGSAHGQIVAISNSMENQASLVQGSVDSQIVADSKAIEIQASLVQGSVDSQIVAISKAMENQASLVQGSVDGQMVAGSKAMENQASLVQGSVDSQIVAISKAMENQACLVQGSADGQIVAISKAMENQASLVQGSVDSQIVAISKAMENQASLVQGSADGQMVAGSKAMEIQVSLVQGSVDSQIVAGTKAMENEASLVQGSVDGQMVAISKAMETQASLVQRSVDGQIVASSNAMETQASLVQGSVDSQIVAGSKALEIQASLVQGSVDSQICEGSTTMENQASLVQGSVDSQMVEGSKVMENQASLVQGSADSQMVAGSKAMENQASLVQGPVDSQMVANSRAMENQASLVHGSADSQIAVGSKSMENQYSFVQRPVDGKTVAGSKAMENQACLVPADSQISESAKVFENQSSPVQDSVESQNTAGSNVGESQAPHVHELVDHQTATKSRPMENQPQDAMAVLPGPVSGRALTESVVKNQTSLAMGATSGHNDSMSRIEVKQSSPTPDWAVANSESVWQARENRSVPVAKQALTEMKPPVRDGAFDIKTRACSRPSPTQPYVASGANSPGVQDHMVVLDTKAPTTQVSGERKSFQNQIYSSNFNETWSNQYPCDTVLPANDYTVSRHAMSGRTEPSHARKKTHANHDEMGLYQQRRRKRHRKTKAPSTLKRDRARTQQRIQEKKLSILGEKKWGETSMTQNNSCHLPRQEERTARSCTACVGTLLEHAGNSTDVIKLKQNIVLVLAPDQFHDETRTIYGAVVHLLPNKKEFQMRQLMYAPRTGPHETCVHNMVRELKAEGKTIGHLLHYFCQEGTKRADIVKLITEMHQCDFCTNTSADVV